MGFGSPFFLISCVKSQEDINRRSAGEILNFDWVVVKELEVSCPNKCGHMVNDRAAKPYTIVVAWLHILHSNPTEALYKAPNALNVRPGDSIP